MAKAFMATSIFLSNIPTLPTNAELGRSLRRIPSVRAVARRRGLPSAGQVSTVKVPALCYKHQVLHWHAPELC